MIPIWIKYNKLTNIKNGEEMETEKTHNPRYLIHKRKIVSVGLMMENNT